MGRRLFLTHLDKLSGAPYPGIQALQSLDEGIVAFTYICPAKQSQRVTIQLCASNLDEYPDGNSFILCTDDDNLPPVIPKTLQRVTDGAHGKNIYAVLEEIRDHLTTAMISGDAGGDTWDDEVEDDDDFAFAFEGDSDEEDFRFNDVPSTDTRHARGPATDSVSKSTSSQVKIRQDLMALKEAGFRVGLYGNLTTSGVLCISIRVAKLGLSDEAMQAWTLDRKYYLVLLIRYSQGYRSALDLANKIDLSNSMEMRVGLCENYKPSFSHVQYVFQHKERGPTASKDKVSDTAEKVHSFEPLFISKPINQLVTDCLFKIISARSWHGVSWLGAEQFVDNISNKGSVEMEPYQRDDRSKAENLPAVVNADHMGEVPLRKASLPLIMMQFVLRHVVRCTEFCLVCHCRVDDSFEALKPYVCSKPLCLYQYMALGFGPSLEWEVLVQPCVVDLLVSFCYAAAHGNRLKDLPIGMNLTVPVLPYDPPQPATIMPSFSVAAKHIPLPVAVPSLKCSWSLPGRYLTVDKSNQEETARAKKIKPGEWLVLLNRQHRLMAHYRVREVDLPEIHLGEAIFVPFIGSGKACEVPEKDPEITDPSFQGECFLYDQNFDELLPSQQRQAIMTLLNALPGVEGMRANLKSQAKGQVSSLKAWSDRISEPALNLLRWIVASNRSCILQIDHLDEENNSLLPKEVEDHVGGMGGLMQFRFAQGAPDKEKRFNDSVKEEAAKTRTYYPTLFAWHGSRLQNWHSIIRQGLRYDDVVNGRAFGNGVYMSPHAVTSMQYCTNHSTGSGTGEWGSSMLKIVQAFSLNEVVNNPEAYVHTNPHYVVSDIDWIQTRYLFVKTKVPVIVKPDPENVYQQDPTRLARNEANVAIKIPLSAISKSRRPGNSVETTATPQGKRVKTWSGTDQETAERQEDDADSIVSDLDDLALFRDISEDCTTIFPESPVIAGGRGKKRAPEDPETDFVPGTLDTSGIKFMDPPNDATSASAQALMRLLREALSVQGKTPPATLGWHIDSNLVNNMYQWIVELHSFPKDLPLAKDLKEAGLTSVVLEVRFTNQIPFSPPFIRVVKPRFLSFNQGGGGNITEGGAMCMEVLTNNGWSAGLSMESLLLQVRLVICDEERPARLARGWQAKSTYGIGEAMEAYVRACKAHGWTVPAGFKSIQA